MRLYDTLPYCYGLTSITVIMRVLEYELRPVKARSLWHVKSPHWMPDLQIKTPQVR